MDNFWKDKSVLVTGSRGFLGSHLVKRLLILGCSKLSLPVRPKYDLKNEQDVMRLYFEAQPDIVIHLAAEVGGLPANLNNPGSFFYDNLKMGMEMMDIGRLNDRLQKFVQMGSACEYPQTAAVPMREDDLWSGYPEPTNAPYGIAKKALLVQGQAYREQYGMPVIHLLSTNLYGPGDNFNLETSHVIPAIIKKCIAAKKDRVDSITLWGTGDATRDSLYVTDAVDGILMAAEYYDSPEPVNLGTGRGVSIKAMAEMIRVLVGFEGEFIWDASKPNGQLKRFLDTTRAEKFGFKAARSLEDGLKETIAWYESTL